MGMGNSGGVDASWNYQLAASPDRQHIVLGVFFQRPVVAIATIAASVTLGYSPVHPYRPLIYSSHLLNGGVSAKPSIRGKAEASRR